MEKAVALYIHIPFCRQKCLYCDFNSCSGMEALMVDYAKALSAEIDSIENKNISSVFIGGGTPTYLNSESWGIIGESLKKLNIEKDAEFTVEGNPGTFDLEKLILLKSLGVNRLSIGLQAWQNSLLKKLGRIHTVEDFLRGYGMAREAGFQNINIDLMFGLPDQSMAQWEETINEVINLKPEHISCYSLIIEAGTAFCNMYESDELILPDEETERNMYYYSLNKLKENEYNQYEISNFALEGRECRHNLVYWKLKEYIGCGSGAHSYLNSIRYRNEEDLKEYINKINNRASVIIESRKNTLKDEIEEYIFMGLRKTEGISISEFEKRFKRAIFSIYEDIIEKHNHRGKLIKAGGRMFLSSEGICISNSVMSDFILDKNIIRE